MGSESWFRNLWFTNRLHHESSRSPLIGVLTFEIANLMAKLNHLWKCLSDKNIAGLRNEILNSYGIRDLISDDDDYIAGLICGEMMDNLNLIAKVVGRLAVKCSDLSLRSFESAFGELVKSGTTDLCGWMLSIREMEKKVKKMERFVVINSSLHRELEMLSQLEYNMRRFKSSEYEKKFAWKKREVKQLKEISFWNKSYDYVILLLARCLFTIFRRIGHVFGTNHHDIKDLGSLMHFDFIDRSQSVSSKMQSSIHPSETRPSIPRFSSGPIDKWVVDKREFYSGPLGRSTTLRSDQTGSMKKKTPAFFSGPLEKSSAPSGILPSKSGFRLWPFKGKRTTQSKQENHKVSSAQNNLPVNSQSVLNAPPPPGTLGAAALASHYANVIIFIEKLATSPHLIGQDARDDLYSMLPSSVRATLREKLKPHAKSLVYDTVLGENWSDSISEMLEWLAPLAHDTIRWQSERSFEHQDVVSQTNVFLVQTLHFADQEKTEAAIVELLLGLNYIWRLGRELSTNLMLEDCASDRMLHNSLNLEGLY